MLPPIETTIPATPTAREHVSSPPAAPAASDRADPGAASPRDPRTLPIVAKTIYRELRQSGLTEKEVMSVAGELLGLLAADVRARRLAGDSR